MIIRLKLSLFENTCVHPWWAWLLECSYGLDTHADTNSKSVVGEVVPQEISEQVKWVSFNITHSQELLLTGVLSSSSPHLLCRTNSEFSEICDLMGHFYLFVQVEWSWPFLKPNQRASVGPPTDARQMLAENSEILDFISPVNPSTPLAKKVTEQEEEENEVSV